MSGTNGKKPQKNKIKRFVFIGPSHKCPCCDKPLPTKAGATLTPVSGGRKEIPEPVVDGIFEYALNNRVIVTKHVRQKDPDNPGFRIRVPKEFQRIRCACKRVKSATLYWVEIEDELVVGPWCDVCFRYREYQIFKDHPKNLVVYVVPVAQVLAFLDKNGFTSSEVDEETEDADETAPTPEADLEEDCPDHDDDGEEIQYF